MSSKKGISKLGAQKNTITINGRIYDTATGQVIPSSVPQPSPTTVAQVFVGQSKKTKRHEIPVAMSSEQIIRPSTPKTAAKKSEVIHVKVSNSPSHAPKAANRAVSSTATGLHQKTERPKTLMRHIVKKPTAHKTGQATVAISGLVAQPKHQIVRGNLPERQQRASNTMLSSRVSKFAPNHTGHINKKTKTIPVVAAPRDRTALSPASFAIKQAPPLTTVRPKTDQNILETALRNADSHRATNIGSNGSHSRQRKNRLRHIGSSLALVLVLGGFFAYNNLPGIALRNASSQIGFSAAVPKYKPTGFGLTKTIAYQPGRVILNFQSNTDTTEFSLTQEKTTLDNARLASVYLEDATSTRTETNAKGKKIYIYNGSQATWIDNGIRYDIQGDAQLSTDQLLNLSASL